MERTLLAIDDQEAILKLINFFFSKKYTVKTYADAEEALQWLQQGNLPDIIIADINMPKTNGFELINNLRASGFFRNIPLIMLSGNEDTKDKIKCLRLGADDYMVKPFNPDELDARIDNIFRRIKM